MLLTAPIFIFVFLPLTVLCYWLLIQSSFKNFIGSFLCLVSLVFYAYDSFAYLAVIAVSIGINYSLGWILSQKGRVKILLVCGIIFNLLWLGWFKYLNFAIDIFNAAANASVAPRDILLPVGISFYTFQQLAWLIDMYRGHLGAARPNFIDYCCFVTFFPQLMAGPIVHHSEMMPQFHNASKSGIDWEQIFNGIVLCSIGLAKKILIADNLAPIVAACFDKSPSLTFLEAILASLTYTMQLYFDFSGYCDIAIGCGLLFNIKLPLNFNSPYLSSDIREFWHRWHITLSRWLRDYLYIPLGGNRKGSSRTLANLFLTFLLGGIWHGAAWTFALWGAMHGAAIGAHRVWKKLGFTMPRLPAIIFTFLFINMGWIVFRAKDGERLGKFWDALLGYNGFALRFEVFSERALDSIWRQSFTVYVAGLAFCMALVFAAPNAAEILRWPDRAKLWLALILSLVLTGWLLAPRDTPPFIYSRF